MTCKKCGSEMYYSNVYKVRAYTCYMCGNVFYPDYPKRSAPANVCDLCGEEYERRDFRQHLCTQCRKLHGKNFHKVMAQLAAPMFPRAVAWNDRKTEAIQLEKLEAQLR